jgi:hypothetical protein
MVIFFFLISSAFLISFFFSTNSRQPKTISRASFNSQPTTHNPSTSLGVNPQPTTSSRSFGNLPILSASPALPETVSFTGFGQIIPTLIPSPKPTRKPPSTPRKTIRILVKNDAFTPNALEAEPGQVLTLIVTAEDKAYDITFPELGVFKEFPQRTEGFVEFQVPDYGQYVFYCGGKCNNASSARGTLTIK